MHSNGVHYFVALLNALQGLVQFYSVNYRDVNLDGLFGLRIMEGQLLHIFIDYKHDDSREFNLKPDALFLIGNLSKRASSLANMAIPYLHEQDSAYFTKLKGLVDRPWSVIGQPIRRINKKIISHQYSNVQGGLETKDSSPLEKEIDFCIANLLAAENSCELISADCLYKMLSFKREMINGYRLTHGILYAGIAEQVFCGDRIDAFLKQSLKFDNGRPDFFENICARLLSMMHFDMSTDLLMEIAFVCGNMGFVDFIRSDWLDLILDLQDKQIGCYKYVLNKNDVMKAHEKDFRHARIKRKEQVLANSCSSHESAVAAGALCTYLRFLLFPGINDYSIFSGPLLQNLPAHSFWNRSNFNIEQFIELVQRPTIEIVDGDMDSLTGFGPPPISKNIDNTFFACLIVFCFFILLLALKCFSRRLRVILGIQRKVTVK